MKRYKRLLFTHLGVTLGTAQTPDTQAPTQDGEESEDSDDYSTESDSEGESGGEDEPVRVLPCTCSITKQFDLGHIGSREPITAPPINFGPPRVHHLPLL